MIRSGFLSEGDRKALIALARDGLAAGRVTRRATALVRLDEGLSCQEVAKVLLFDDDTIRGWYELFEQDGVEGLSRFEMGGSAGKMSAERCDALKAWVETSLPRSTRQVGCWIAWDSNITNPKSSPASSIRKRRKRSSRATKT